MKKTLGQEAGHPPRAELPSLQGPGQTLYVAGLSSNVSAENYQDNLPASVIQFKILHLVWLDMKPLHSTLVLGCKQRPIWQRRIEARTCN